MLKPIVKKTKYGWRGWVECWDETFNGLERIWKEKAGPVRITKEDALEDAEWHKGWREA